MKIKLNWLKKFVAALLVLVDEAKIVIGKDGFTSLIVDTSHVAMAHITLSKKAFKKYSPPRGKDTIKELGLDLHKLLNVLKLGKDTDVCTLTVDSEKNKLVIKFNNLTRRIGLIDATGMMDPKIPTLELAVNGTVTTDALILAAKACNAVSDHLTISTKKGKPCTLTISTVGDTDSVDIKHTVNEDGDLTELEFDVVDSSKTTLSLSYFTDIVKGVSSPTITFRTGNDFPIEFTSESDEMTVLYLLAPRIESD